MQKYAEFSPKWPAKCGAASTSAPVASRGAPPSKLYTTAMAVMSASRGFNRRKLRVSQIRRQANVHDNPRLLIFLATHPRPHAACVYFVTTAYSRPARSYRGLAIFARA